MANSIFLQNGRSRPGLTIIKSGNIGYEEGYYVPTLTCSTSGSYTLNSDEDTLAYTKIGRVVTLQGQITVTGESSPSGSLLLSIPFPIAALTEKADTFYVPFCLRDHGDAGLENPALLFEPGLSVVRLTNFTDTGAKENIDETRMGTVFIIYVNCQYIAG